MRADIVIVATTAILLGTTVFAVAESNTYQKGKARHLRAAPERTMRPYARYYNAAPGRVAPAAPAAGYYNYTPGPSGYYNRSYWTGVWNVAPDFYAGPSPYRGTPFYDVAPY
jgi:hypothetical protein